MPISKLRQCATQPNDVTLWCFIRIMPMQNASALFCMLFFQTLIFHHAFYGVFYIPQRDAFVFKIRLVHILVVDYQV